MFLRTLCIRLIFLVSSSLLGFSKSGLLVCGTTKISLEIVWLLFCWFSSSFFVFEIAGLLGTGHDQNMSVRICLAFSELFFPKHLPLRQLVSVFNMYREDRVPFSVISSVLASYVRACFGGAGNDFGGLQGSCERSIRLHF